MFNQLKTIILLGCLSGLLLLMGSVLGGSQGIITALVIAVVMNIVAYYYSGSIALSVYRAQPLDQNRFAYVYRIVEELCFTARIPMPKLWYISSPMANAFATGRNPHHASVAVTQGILDLLTDDELRGVLAHELAHVINRDILVGTVAATIATAIGYVADMLRWSMIFGHSRSKDRNDSGLGAFIAMLLMPLVATLIQLGISRSREYLADESGARLCQDPLALAAALEKLATSTATMRARPQSDVQATMASLFIVFPFTGKSITHIFSTHPPIEERIKRLRSMHFNRY